MKVGLVSLGCPKNLVDSEVMLGLAEQAGHEVAADSDAAAVLIVNTCAFVDAAKQESVDTILEMVERKRSGACQRLIVTGCLAERYRDELQAQIPEIDVVLGTGEVAQIAAAIRGLDPGTMAVPARLFQREELQRPPAAADAPPLVDSTHRNGSVSLPTYIYDAETPRKQATPGHYAYVKIAEGCDYTCAFCIIPTLRGHYRSRPAASIVREAQALADRGVRELLLISQDSTFYGVDRRDRGALARLLRDLNRVDGLAWIRLLYLYPTTITDDTVGAMAECEKVCKYIDLPLQHASDGVLRRMHRPGSRRSYEKLLASIRARIPDVTLRTTVIVGFPGETEADFAQLCDFVTATRFEHLGAFTYSHEEGTSAFALPDDVPARVKTGRRRRLMRLQQQLVADRQQRRIGTRVRLMFDGLSKEHSLVGVGRLPGQAPDIDGLVYLTECAPSEYRAGDLLHAEIVGARGYDLLARPLA